MKRKSLVKNQDLISISADRIISEYVSIAFSNISDILQFDGDSYIMRHNLDPSILKSVHTLELKQTTYGPEFKIKMHNKLHALKFLAQYLGMCKDCKDFEHLNRIMLSLNEDQLNQLIHSMENHVKHSVP